MKDKEGEEEKDRNVQTKALVMEGPCKLKEETEISDAYRQVNGLVVMEEVRINSNSPQSPLVLKEESKMSVAA